jgi:hypothetical protein
MKLGCACGTSGHDLGVYGVIDLSPERARRLLGMRALISQAEALMSAVYGVEVWDCEVQFSLRDPRPEREGAGIGDPEEWTPVEADLAEDDEARAEVQMVEVVSEGVYLSAEVGEIRVETPLLTWRVLSGAAEAGE